MKKIGFSITVLLIGYSCAYGFEQKKHFDIINYLPPPGWQVREAAQNALVSFEKTDRSNNIYCEITVYASRPSSGDLSKDFSAEWKDVVESHTVPESSPNPTVVPNKSAGGAAYVTEKSSKIRYFTALNVLLSGNNEMAIQSISLTLESLGTDCLPEIESFFKSIEFVAQPRASDEPSTSRGSAASAGSGEITIASLTGKWSTSSPGSEAYQRYEFHPNRTWTFSSRAVRNMNPWLGYLDRHEAGTFQIAGDYLLLWKKEDTASPGYPYRAWFEKRDRTNFLCLVQKIFFDGLNGPNTKLYKLCYERSQK